MAYKYTKEEALQKAIILDKLTMTLQRFVADADVSLKTPRDDVAHASVKSFRDTTANVLELIELLERTPFRGEVTS